MITARILASLPQDQKEEAQFSISDAMDIGFDGTKKAVEKIFALSFAGDPDVQTSSPPSYDVEIKYFDTNQKETAKAELILLAKIKNEICGFIIVAKYKTLHDFKLYGFDPDIAVVKWLAVDPSVKKCGIGTALMIEAMRHAKKAGKHFLSAKFRGPGKLKNINQDEEPTCFYESFHTKHEIERSYDFPLANGYRNIIYDLDYDFSTFPQYNKNEKNKITADFGLKLPSGSAHLWPRIPTKISVTDVDKLRPNSIFYR